MNEFLKKRLQRIFLDTTKPCCHDRNVALRLLLISMLVLALQPSARADIYECVGRGGEIHYGTARKRGMRCRLKYSAAKKRKTSSNVTVVSAPQKSSKVTKATKLSDTQAWLRYGDTIREAANRYSLPPSLIRAVMRVESRFNEQALSRVGAMGLMQMMPRTARSMGVSDPYDARQNILGGARFLRTLANRFGGDVVLTLAAYNAGAGAVAKYKGIPPYAETQRYVRRVLSYYYTYRAAGHR